MGEVVVLWLATTSDGLPLVEARVARGGLRILRCAVRDLRVHTLASSSPAPVVAVVDSDRAAIEALAAGVDEVVRADELTEDGIDRAVVRAEARVAARARVTDPARRDQEPDVLASLLDWIAIELVACISGAVLEGELLEESVRRLLAERAARGERSEAIPSAADTLEMLDTVRESFRRMNAVLDAVRNLSGSDQPPTVIEPVLTALARILLNRAIPVADIEVDADARCATSVRTTRLVGALVSLVGNVFDRAARTKRPRDKRVHVTLRAFAAEGAAIVEIEDDVGDLAREAAAVAWRPDPITEIRARLREEGGDVVVAVAPGRTTVRLVLPLEENAQSPAHEDRTRDLTSRPN